MDPLVQRVVGHHLLQLGNKPGVLSRRQPGLRQFLPDPHLEQVQALRLRRQPGQFRDIGQRPAPPQRQRVLQVPHRAGRVGGLRALLQEPFGHLHVGAVAGELQDVTGRPGEDRGLGPQNAAQVGHVSLQTVHRGRGRVLPPDRVGELVGADDPAAVKRQNGQHRLAPQAVHRPRLTPEPRRRLVPEDVSASLIPVCV